MKNKEFFSTTEVAKMLGVSRITVFKKIKSGKIKARRIGRNFYVLFEDLPIVLGTVVTDLQKKNIEQAVKKAVHQYGETFRLLGQE